MKKQIVSFLIGIGIIALSVSSFAQVQKLYVKVPKENLRAAPKGKKIGTLLEGTETTVLVEKGNWVKVQITGWIWKPSMTSVQPRAAQGQMRALHILVKTRAEAEEILKLLKSGKDFAELAKKRSIAPNAAKGGDLGYFNKGDFDPKIEAVIDTLKINQISEIVQTQYGFNIFKRIK